MISCDQLTLVLQYWTADHHNLPINKLWTVKMLYISVFQIITHQCWLSLSAEILSINQEVVYTCISLRITHSQSLTKTKQWEQFLNRTLNKRDPDLDAMTYKTIPTCVSFQLPICQVQSLYLHSKQKLLAILYLVTVTLTLSLLILNATPSCVVFVFNCSLSCSLTTLRH